MFGRPRMCDMTDNGERKKSSVADAVSQITVKALQQYRSRHEEDGEPDEGPLVPQTDVPDVEDEEAVQTEVPKIYAVVDPTTTLLGNRGVEVAEDDVDSDEELDGENEMVVLDPDHPLMQRVQAALTDQLTRQRERLELELREKLAALTAKQDRREAIGVELYRLQQHLAKQQANLESEHDKHRKMQHLREQCDWKLAQTKDTFLKAQNELKDKRQRTDALRGQVESLSDRLNYINSAKTDTEKEIAVKKRHAEKADVEVAGAERAKQLQDLYVDRLTDIVRQLREQIAMYESQTKAQQEEYRATQDALAEALTEMEALNLEQKQLLQQWNSSVIGMKRRDEALSAMNTAVNLQADRLQSLATEIDGYKRSVMKEQEKNETLTIQYRKLENDLSLVKRQMAMCESRREALRVDYSKFTRILHETEQNLTKATTDHTLLQNDTVSLRKQTEREVLEKNEIEDTILEKTMTQLTLDKASAYTRQEANKTRKKIKEGETTVAQVENELSRQILGISNTTARLERLQQVINEQNEEVKQLNAMITRGENEAIKRNAVIERKQGMIDQMNKKIDQLTSGKDGVEELGPLEVRIQTLQKQISESVEQCGRLQHFWLRQQYELVRQTQEAQDQHGSVQELKRTLTILEQKKMRLNAEIDRQNKEMSDVQRSIRLLQNDMTKLNQLITKNRGQQDLLEQGNSLMESDFIHTLKEAELDCIQLQTEVSRLKEEKERGRNGLLEAERQILLWERKIQLAKEMRAAVDSEDGQGEIKGMKAEIHRMEVRFGQLMRQQERMIQDMEKAVYRRETITFRGEAQAKMGKKNQTRAQFQKKTLELKKKIKQTSNDATLCDRMIRELRSSQQSASQQLEEKQRSCQQLRSSVESVDAEIEELQETKQRKFAELVAEQKRLKYLQQVKEGRYSMLCKTDEDLQAEAARQDERLQALASVVDRLNMEYPQAQSALRKTTLMLGWKMGTAEGTD